MARRERLDAQAGRRRVGSQRAHPGKLGVRLPQAPRIVRPGEAVGFQAEDCRMTNYRPAVLTLFDALRLLADAHTRGNDVTGFVVETAASPVVDSKDYVRAWRTVREQLRLQTMPKEEA